MKAPNRLCAALLMFSCGALNAASAQEAPRSPAPAAVKPQGDKKRTDGKPPKLAPEIENLINDARAAAPELAADALIRLAESAHVADREIKRDLLTEAFRTAANARHPFKLRSVDGHVDTRPGYLTMAFETLRMDALSLRLRAVRALLKTDKRQARTLFAELPARLPLQPVACESPLVADVADFYETLALVARETFTPAEARREEDVRFAEPYVEALSSPAQVGPLAKAVASIADSPARLETLTRAFARSLRNLSGDDRAFSFWLYGAVDGVGVLGEKSKRLGLAQDELLAAARGYVVRHLEGARCADNAAQTSRVAASDYFKRFDETLSGVEIDGRALPPVAFDELRPSRVEGEAKVFHHWRSPAGASLLRKARELSFTDGKRLSDEERRAPAWDLKLTEFLNELEDWNERAEATPADYFHQKCVLYFTLLNLIPPGPNQDRVLRDFVGFLRQPTLQQDALLEWLLHVKHTLRGRATTLDKGKLLAAFGASGDPALRLLADLERLTPPAPAPTPAKPR